MEFLSNLSFYGLAFTISLYYYALKVWLRGLYQSLLGLGCSSRLGLILDHDKLGVGAWLKVHGVYKLWLVKSFL